MVGDKTVLTTFEAARVCNVSYNTIKNWIKKGLLDAYRTAGGHLRIRREELERFAREHAIPTSDRGFSAGRRVLIVDDEVTVRDGLREVLTQYSERLDIYTAADGFEAGALLEGLKPDLVILDLIMPGLDGFKVCQRIRKSPEMRRTKILVLTGFPTEQNIAKVTEMGADHCLAKPIDKKALFEVIDGLFKTKGGVRKQRKK